MWTPCQRRDWLGITWDSARGTIAIFDRRVTKIASTIDSIIDSDLFRFVQICSTAPVSGKISRIMERLSMTFTANGKRQR